LSWATLISLEPIGTSWDTERIMESMPCTIGFVHPAQQVQGRSNAGLVKPGVRT
jgi:hypothetical protein